MELSDCSAMDPHALFRSMALEATSKFDKPRNITASLAAASDRIEDY